MPTVTLGKVWMPDDGEDQGPPPLVTAIFVVFAFAGVALVGFMVLLLVVAALAR